MPKAELHVHLEGTISAETLWTMAGRNQVALPVGSLDELRALYRFESFDTFLHLWMAMCRCLRREADYEHMVDAFLEDSARVNLRYAEAHFTPYNHERFGFGGRRALEIVTRRLERAEANGGPVVRLILDIPSESVPESGPYTTTLLEEEANPLVVAIGLGGPEEGFPRTLVIPYFDRAREAGYPAVAHAGETGGPEHVRQAVLDLKVRRVQHGVRAVEDEATLRLLAEREVCCDVALTSNTFLTVYRELSAHPLRRMLAAGVPVTISTDDPPFFGTDLVSEYRRAHDEMGFSMEELWQLNLNGLRYGLADVGLRRRLRREFDESSLSRGALWSRPPEPPRAARE
ncbi:MAG TPA: adenosine deaminase [Vicinamibacteria bacterium]